MEMLTCCLLGLAVIISGIFLLKRSQSGRKLPPGPRGLPLIGCPWALRNDFHTLFTELAKSYGDIVSVDIMGKTIIVLNSAETVREAFTSVGTAEIFAGRGTPPGGNEEVRYMTSFIQPGPVWQNQRKLIHKIVNHYGDRLRQTEEMIQGELTHVLDWLGSRKGPVNMDEIIYPSLINVMSVLIQGRRYDYGSPVLNNVRVVDETRAQSSSAALNLLFLFLPFLKFVPIGPGKIIRQFLKACEQFHKDYFEHAKATYDPNVTRGMADFLLHHQRESRLQDGETWLEDKIIRAILQEMLTAGIMTTRGALYSFFLIMAHKPEVTRKIQVEIDAVVEGGRLPKLDDRMKMPYTMAVIFELLRFISHVPFGLLHLTTDDVKFHGYEIPKNTTIAYNSWCFHHDQKTFPDPWEFIPERFLTSDGQLVPPEHPNRKNWMPFGVGRRSCVGEPFAKSRMFLFITTILQKFSVTEHPAIALRSCDPRAFRRGIVLSPYIYYVNVVPRNKAYSDFDKV